MASDCPLGRYMVNVLKFGILFSNKTMVIRPGVHKMLVRIANWKDPE